MRNVYRVFLSFSISILVASTALGAPAQAATATFNCGAGDYVVVDGVASGGGDCTGALIVDSTATSIAASGFERSDITSIEIPASVTSVGNGAFMYSPKVTSVVFVTPSNLVTIEESAFRGLIGVSSITLPDSVRTIGNFAFLDSSWTDVPRTDQMLATLNLGQGVTSIGAETFVGIQPTVLTIPASITNIGDHAFWKLMNLTTINFAQGSALTSLETNSFDEIPNLSRVYYCGTPPSILANYAFPNGIIISNGNCPITAISKVSNPSVIGSAKKGKVLRQVAGQWNGSDRLVTYQWYRCSKQVKSSFTSKPAKCSSIAGARGQSYKLAKKDKNKYVLVAVTARNSISSLTSWSKSTKKIK